jgi:phytoene desaturase
MNKRITIIGAGFSGLSSACYLAKAGYQVSVLEKHSTPGGRARKFEEEGFVFDMGPSWYWMPGVFEKFFADFGKKVEDYYHLERLDPSYQVIFEEGQIVKVPAKLQELYDLFEEVEPGSSQHLKNFLEEAKYKYDTGMGEFVQKPSLSIMEFADLRVLMALIKLDMLKSVSSVVKSKFKDSKLQRILEFPVLFLGARPQETPALYTLMNYADLSLGTWYPMGGMYQIVEAMYSLAKDLGVEFEFSADVLNFEYKGKNISSVVTSGGKYMTDIVVASCDYHHIDTKVLEPIYRNYSEEYWEKRIMAPSSLLYYLGVDKSIPKLKHHNLFFDEDFNVHAHEIYKEPKWPEKPLFYACVPSKTDPSVAPKGKENIFLLVPIAPGLHDTPEILEKYYDLMIDKLEKFTGESIKEHVIVKKTFSPSVFIKDYNAFKGNAYGLANTLMQTAFLKPKMKNKNLNNLYFTGQLTVPGPGVPPSIISGQVVCGLIRSEHSLGASALESSSTI